jgi:hypothetical protein
VHVGKHSKKLILYLCKIGNYWNIFRTSCIVSVYFPQNDIYLITLSFSVQIKLAFFIKRAGRKKAEMFSKVMGCYETQSLCNAAVMMSHDE